MQSRDTNWIVDPFTQVKSAEHMSKNQFQILILWFSFLALTRLAQNKPSALIRREENKVEFLSKDNFLAKSSHLSTKGN